MMDRRIRVGISACLLGEPVRFNGGHTRDRYITDTLAKYMDFFPVCPEVECGFPTPREAFRLVGDPESPRLVTSRTGVDHTERMTAWCRARVEELESEDLCGFIFMKGSPSSGMERVKVYTEQGMPSKTGVGMFARAFMEHFPTIPVEEDGRLHDPKLRENFIELLFTYKRWRDVLGGARSRGALVDFHTRHKLLIMSHSPRHYREMGKLTADVKAIGTETAFARYGDLLVEALRLKTTAKKHADVLHHIMGYFKKELSKDEKQELLEVIQQYRDGLTPLIVPITLMNHFVRKYDQPYLRSQVYLNPHPMELQLRNHV